MTIIEALVKLRNDLKLWVTNNLRVKMDKNLGEEEANKVLITNENGDVVTSDDILAASGITATPTELNYCSGVTSNIQTQIDETVQSISDLHHVYSGTDEPDNSIGKNGDIYMKIVG